MKTNNLQILLYHGVTKEKTSSVFNYSKKHLEVEVFEAQIRNIKDKYNIISMDEVIKLKMAGRPWPEKSIAVTFDDGFMNNFTVALPILKKYEIPTTFYICSGMINTDMMFWVDQIEDCIARCPKKKIEIMLKYKRSFDIDDDDRKIAAINEIKKFCKLANKDTKNKVVNDLIYATGISPSVQAWKDYTLMGWDQVQEISNNELFIIGGHTLYHDILSSQPEKNMKLDIATTLSLIEYNTGIKTEHFSYPEGQKNHYNDAVIDALKDNGIKCCPSAIHGINSRKVDLFHLRRMMPGFMGREVHFI